MQFHFGDLEALVPFMDKGHMYWRCKCACGNTKAIRDEHLKSGRSTSCGLCNYKEKHPLAHKSWDSMKQRCNNPNAPDYPRYGGRGITICKEWDKFTAFLADMGDPPVNIHGERATLNRINNDGNYEKSNCKWSFSFEQSNNRRDNIHQGFRKYSNGNKRL